MDGADRPPPDRPMDGADRPPPDRPMDGADRLDPRDLLAEGGRLMLRPLVGARVTAPPRGALRRLPPGRCMDDGPERFTPVGGLLRTLPRDDRELAAGPRMTAEEGRWRTDELERCPPDGRVIGADRLEPPRRTDGSGPRITPLGVERWVDVPPRVARGGATLDGVARPCPVDGLAVLRLPGLDREDGARTRSEGLREAVALCTPPAGALVVRDASVERVVVRVADVGLVRAPVLIREEVFRPETPEVTLCPPLRDAVERDAAVRPSAAPFNPVTRDPAEAVLVVDLRGFSLNVVARGENTATVRP